jgi:hypothetical protein
LIKGKTAEKGAPAENSIAGKPNTQQVAKKKN